MPIRWAIADTLAPGSNASATSCALNSFDQRRRSRRGAPSSRSATASIIWKVLVSELGADTEAHFGSQQAIQIADPQSPTPDGVSLPLTVVRIFPNAESCLRLVRALAVETNENWMEANRYINMDDLREHKKLALRQAA